MSDENEAKIAALVAYCSTFRLGVSEETLVIWMMALERHSARSVANAVAKLVASPDLQLRIGVSALSPLLQELKDQALWDSPTVTTPESHRIEDPAGKACTFAEYVQRSGNNLPWRMSSTEQAPAQGRNQ